MSLGCPRGIPLYDDRLTLPRAREEAERRYRRAHTHKPKVGGTVPDFERMDAPVKLNVASILREDAVYKKKQEKEKKLIEAYESELRDSTAFYKWQKGMRDQDERERIEAVERRRVEMAASARAARRKKASAEHTC